MYNQALSIYNALLLFVIGTAFFAFHPSDIPEVKAMQQDITRQTMVAWQQTFGDQPLFTEVVFVYEAITGFYEHSSLAAISMLADPQSDADIAYVFGSVYDIFKQTITTYSDTIAAGEQVPLPSVENFMDEEPLYNIVPYRTVVKTYETLNPVIAGVSLDEPVNNPSQPWVTIKDNSTGQLYCLAIYNGTVNNYLGACANDFH